MRVFRQVEVLGVRYHILQMCDLMDYVVQHAGEDTKTVIASLNVRGANFAYELPWYRDFLNSADLVFCDGAGIILGSKMLGHNVSLKNRMTCPDFIEIMAHKLADQNLSLFLLAGKPGIAESATHKLKTIAPNLRLGFHHGYFQKSGSENQKILSLLEEFKPDVLYVGFGMPLQEQWVHENFASLSAHVIILLGGCLDVYTGELYRSPRWLTDRGFEWLGRFLTEPPKRVWKRYLIGNPIFIIRVLKQKFSGK